MYILCSCDLSTRGQGSLYQSSNYKNIEKVRFFISRKIQHFYVLFIVTGTQLGVHYSLAFFPSQIIFYDSESSHYCKRILLTLSRSNRSDYMLWSKFRWIFSFFFHIITIHDQRIRFRQLLLNNPHEKSISPTTKEKRIYIK